MPSVCGHLGMLSCMFSYGRVRAVVMGESFSLIAGRTNFGFIVAELHEAQFIILYIFQ